MKGSSMEMGRYSTENIWRVEGEICGRSSISLSRFYSPLTSSLLIILGAGASLQFIIVVLPPPCCCSPCHYSTPPCQHFVHCLHSPPSPLFSPLWWQVLVIRFLLSCSLSLGIGRYLGRLLCHCRCHCLSPFCVCPCYCQLVVTLLAGSRSGSIGWDSGVGPVVTK